MRRTSAMPFFALAALCGSLLASACSSAPKLVSSSELDARERHILELERQTSLARAENETLRARILELERLCAARAAATLEPPAPAQLPV
ncbi:MAG: hypothetical protein ACREI7_04970, partial [Myxococcota bacterium]